MAEHIYKDIPLSDEKDPGGNRALRTVAGWRLINVWKGRESLKMGIYIRDTDDWRNPSEYTVVFKGTNPKNWDDLKNDAEAYFSDKSADMWDAMNYSLGFVRSVGDAEVTFVGHSKGGGEAIAAATYTHKNAITFNAANFAFEKYGLIEEDRTGTIENHYVTDEWLSNLIGPARIGKTWWMETAFWTFDGSGRSYPDYSRNHSMEAVKKVL